MSIIRITISEAAPWRARVDGGRNGGTRSGTCEDTWGNRGIPENVFVAASAADRLDSLGQRGGSRIQRGPLRGWRPQGRGGSNPPFRTIRLGRSDSLYNLAPSLMVGLWPTQMPWWPSRVPSGDRVEWCRDRPIVRKQVEGHQPSPTPAYGSPSGSFVLSERDGRRRSTCAHSRPIALTGGKTAGLRPVGSTRSSERQRSRGR
jgi:hypothetical protein